METYKTVAFHANAEHTAIITALLLDCGFDAAEEGDQETMVSIRAAAYDEAKVREIFDRFRVAFSIDTVQQKNWNATWEESFEPVIVGSFAAVRAAFHAPVPGVRHDVIITPKMSFGTGHHATTFMMIEAMQQLELDGKSVIDFGTGTAVLAILAEKMGAASVLGIDNDEWSMRNARENIEANNCRHITLLLAETMTVDKQADIILANINLNVIVANLENIKASAHGDTAIVLSGFLVTDEAQLAASVANTGFQVIKTFHNNNWLAMLIKTS